MGKEIERKFLIDLARWQRFEKPVGIPLRRGYLLTDPNKTIRVRIAGLKGFLTIKGAAQGLHGWNTNTRYRLGRPRNYWIALLKLSYQNTVHIFV